MNTPNPSNINILRHQQEITPTPPDHEVHPNISLFVYGTLKRGYWNHNRYCRNAIDIRPATVWGRLYQLSAGYPALEISEEQILAHGTADPLANAATQARITIENANISSQLRPTGDWDLIHGELITFADPIHDLPPIDRLEGFRPGMISFYNRELVCVWTKTRSQPAWIYAAAQVLHEKALSRIATF